MTTSEQAALREHVLYLLRGGGAHLDFKAAVADLPAPLRGAKPPGLPHTPWRLVEHLRLAQWDILEFSRNPKHVSPDGDGPWSNAMDLKDKIINVLSQALQPEQVRLDDDDGISGFVVSGAFEGMSTLDRQGKIEELLQNAELTHEQRRRILMIAGLTPEEYEAVGARIRVHRVKEKARGCG
jgi:stress-induced morphogen